jgi:diguanylate cyclase (GGDEF)-like protein/PAS domain S-box-containing protein
VVLGASSQNPPLGRENAIPRVGEGRERRAVDPIGVDECCGSALPASVDPVGYDDVARRYKTLVEQLPLVVYVDALDEASSNIFTSPQVESLLGYTPAEWLVASDLFVRLLHPDDRERVLAAHARTHRTHDPLSLEYRLINREGRVVWVRDEGVIVVDDDGRPLYLQGYLLDITAEREAQAQLRQLALYDALTGLANRAFFHEQFQHIVSIRKEPTQQTALLFIDFNDFKNVNDRWGHDVGDLVLATLGERLQGMLRAGDCAARLGGDEFAIVIPSIAEPTEAVHVAERLLDAIRAPIELERRQLSITASIGISVGSETAVMLQEADAAMYRAKRQQDVGYAFFDPDLDVAAVQRSRRVIELREAVESGQFTLDYQPVINLEAYEIAGYEALLRWCHPTEGVIAPLEFIPLAEECGLIVPLGKWVLAEACRYGAMLQRDMGREIGMAVNVSARQLQHPDFVSHVEEALGDAGFPPHCLTLELTESVLLASGQHTEQRLAALKASGISLALDDFGTGYASLSYLQRFPVDIVKIDRSFTGTIDSGTADLVLLRGIVDLGNALGLNLVAEGIETPAQHEIVRGLGCHGAQGFYFGHPAPDALRRLADRPPVAVTAI